MNRLLIIGRTGQMAQALEHRAPHYGFMAFCRGRSEDNFNSVGTIKNLIDEIKPHAVINAAAYTAVDKAESEAELAYAVNAFLPAMLAEACQKAQLPLIHLSTDYIFSGAKNTPYSEDDLPAPLNVYGHSKLAGEIAIRSAHPAHYIIRTSWIFSAYGHNFVKSMLRLGAERETLRIVDDQIGCPTAANDLADMALKIATSPNDNFGTYHIANGPPTSWHGFATEIFARAEKLGLKKPKALVAIPSQDYQTPAARPKNSVLSCSKLQQNFGWGLRPYQAALDECLLELTHKDSA